MVLTKSESGIERGGAHPRRLASVMLWEWEEQDNLVGQDQRATKEVGGDSECRVVDTGHVLSHIPDPCYAFPSARLGACRVVSSMLTEGLPSIAFQAPG